MQGRGRDGRPEGRILFVRRRVEEEKQEYAERASRDDKYKKTLEASVAQIERESRRLAEKLAEVTAQLDEERTERKAAEALLDKCSDSLLWWGNQATEDKQLVAELQERIARRAGGAEETMKSSTAENAERESGWHKKHQRKWTEGKSWHASPERRQSSRREKPRMRRRKRHDV